MKEKSEKNRKWQFTFPDPLSIAVVLSGFTLVVATLFTPFSFSENTVFWGTGLWSLLSFTTQMCMILLGGFVLASSPIIKKTLAWIASFPETPLGAYLLCFFVSALTCWLNWGMGLILGAFFCLEIGQRNKNVHFPLLVTVSYMGFLFWHGGFSGSIPLVVASREGFSYQWTQKVLPIEETLFSVLNLSIIISLLIAFTLLIIFLARRVEGAAVSVSREEIQREARGDSTKGIDKSLILLVSLILFFLSIQVSHGKFSLGLNEMNLLLILLGLIFHGQLKSYLFFAKKGCEKLVSIIVQFPIYGGIMAVIISSGLGEQISRYFVSISTPETFPVFSFLSAGLVNIFVPSGGGQWAVQAPIMIPAAKELGVPLSKAVMAIAWGDAWTNLAQPFWALPLLSIVEMKIKNIVGYCLSALVVSGTVISLILLIC